jgi:hypothetical protein
MRQKWTRYALFTLVGIAGEDDMDAADLARRPERAAGNGMGSGLNGGNHRIRHGLTVETVIEP